MALASLFNVPTSPEDMRAWSFAHADHHRQMNAAALAQGHVTLPEYILDPVDLSADGAFLDQHQAMHNAIDSLYGVPGYDLSSVDWSDPDQRAGWVWLNAQLHRAEAGATGVY